MPESILVVEYEPRYTDRVKQALAGQPFSPSFARDGEEALRVLAGQTPKLIVVSSVLPKISANELIRTIRNESSLRSTPILLTVSGYSGTAPRADAERVGASDILPKPYSETEFLGKVRQMLGNALDPSLVVKANAPANGSGENSAARRDVKKSPRSVGEDVDRMLAQTLAGVMPQKKKDSTPPAVTPRADSAVTALPASGRNRTASGNLALDKLMEDTWSGLEKTVRAPRPAVPPPPPATPPPAAQSPVAVATPVAQSPATIPPPLQPPPPIEEEVELPTMISRQAIILPAPPPPPAVEEQEPVDGIRFGQYVLLERIATGGMAEVWRARMRGVEGFQKIVAIKKILPHLSDNQDFVEMFVDEAKLAAQLSHTNIVHIFDLGRIQNSYYIAMEYVDGFDLKTILKKADERDQPMQADVALFITSKIATALDYAHRKRDFENRDIGLVHRDVSPQNVLISQEGDIKLCDFGIAKAASKASHTQTGALKGKLQYMSPEQASGMALDRRSDIFSLAAVLFEMLTRRKLFAGETEVSVLDQVREARVTAPSLFNDEVTPEIDAIVLKALARDPDRRYQTAAELARDLDQILYAFRPTPTSADLAIYMHRLSAPESVIEHAETARVTPEAVTEPRVLTPKAVVSPKSPAAPKPVAPVQQAAAVAAPVAVAIPPAAPEAVLAGMTSEEPKKKMPLIPIAAAVLIVAGAAGWYFMRGGSTAPPAAAPAVAAVPHPGTAPVASSTVAAVPTPGVAAPLTTTMPAIDAAKVDEEVRKRLDAERLKLEQQSSRQQTTAASQSARLAPPPPAVTQTQPAPEPVRTAAVPPPTAPPTETRTAPVVQQQAAAVEAPKTREGDTVPQGSEGLVAAHVTRQALPQYPPMARQQRVEGAVIVNVLISETGQVLDAKILAGVNRPVGINEAALQTVRHSTFAPGMKDGVRVKSWTAVKIDFKL